MKDVEVLPPTTSLDTVPVPGFIQRVSKKASGDDAKGKQPVSAVAAALPHAERERRMRGVPAPRDYDERLQRMGASLPGSKHAPPPHLPPKSQRSRTNIYDETERYEGYDASVSKIDDFKATPPTALDRLLAERERQRARRTEHAESAGSSRHDSSKSLRPEGPMVYQTRKLHLAAVLFARGDDDIIDSGGIYFLFLLFLPVF